MRHTRRKQIINETGASMVEAVLIIAFVAIVGAAAIPGVGRGVSATFYETSGNIAGCSNGQDDHFCSAMSTGAVQVKQ